MEVKRKSSKTEMKKKNGRMKKGSEKKQNAIFLPFFPQKIMFLESDFYLFIYFLFQANIEGGVNFSIKKIK